VPDGAGDYPEVGGEVGGEVGAGLALNTGPPVVQSPRTKELTAPWVNVTSNEPGDGRPPAAAQPIEASTRQSTTTDDEQVSRICPPAASNVPDVGAGDPVAGPAEPAVDVVVDTADRVVLGSDPVRADGTVLVREVTVGSTPDCPTDPAGPADPATRPAVDVED
jgi:hypothetical protein